MHKKSFFIGFILGGIIFGSAISWAAMQRIVLLNSNENPIGTAEHPLYIQ